MKEGTRMEDVIEYVIRDGMGKVRKSWTSKGTSHRCLTNSGFGIVAGLLLTDITGGTITAFDYVEIGTGTIVAAPTDVALGTAIKRKAGTGTRIQTTILNDTANLVATFSSADGLSGTSDVSEVGMFNAASGVTMLMRQTFTPEHLDWDAGDSLQMTVKVQMKQGT